MPPAGFFFSIFSLKKDCVYDSLCLAGVIKKIIHCQHTVFYTDFFHVLCCIKNSVLSKVVYWQLYAIFKG